MSVHARKATSLVAVASVVLLGLAACGSPRQPQTYQRRDPGDAANATLNQLALRGVAVLTPPAGGTYLTGDTATLVFVIDNQGGTADALTGISTTAAGGAALNDHGRPAGALPLPPYGGSGNASATLTQLTAPLRAGSYLSVTFTFRNNGSTTVNVPVEVGNSPRPQESPSPASLNG